ncbi:MAG: tRNA methyltransferase [Rickettsiales bacterium]|nr:tRNA methyltransferase [Rickettsiales bacterium]
MLNIVLFQPEIAENLGSIIRTAACFEAVIHIVDPCGFPFVSKRIKLAAMDYFDKVEIIRYKSFADFLDKNQNADIILMTTKSDKALSETIILPDSFFLFGQESSGVPDKVHNMCAKRAKIPINSKTRSLNLAVSVAITAYAATNVRAPL